MEPLKTKKVTIDKYFFTQLGFYFMHVPVFVPYESLKERAIKAGYKLKGNNPDLIESMPSIGYGSVGIEIEKPQNMLKVLHVAGEYHEYIPPQKPNFHLIYRMLQNDFPGMKNIYNYYDKTSADLAVLKILFQV